MTRELPMWKQAGFYSLASARQYFIETCYLEEFGNFLEMEIEREKSIHPIESPSIIKEDK